MKKTTIAKRTLLALGILAFTFTAWAQTEQSEKKVPNHERLLKVFSTSLENKIPGIVESTIYNVVSYKKYYPNLDYSRINNLLNEISQKHEDASIRYKAQLASMYLSEASTLDITPVPGSETHDYLFKQIAQELEKKLLVSN